MTMLDHLRFATRLRFLPLIALTLLSIGCGEDAADPMGPSAPVFEEITVSLDEIQIIQDCDEGSQGDGEFAYKFYVTELIDGEEGATHLSTDYTSFSAGNNTAWDPGQTATFTLERRPGMSFRVRLSMRELDQVEDFQSGRMIWHDAAGSEGPWTPDVGYALYDSSKRTGIVEWDISGGRSTCAAKMTYSVEVKAASSTE